jgi:formylglycine-generating enzyme required for sulfatase activity
MSADIDLDEVIRSHGADEPSRFIAIADHFLALNDRAAAAAALDRAYGLDPADTALARHRAAILDELAVEEDGLVWRYIPAGTFLMGSETGDPDERPVHPRTLGAFWITDVPITWTAFCRLVGWGEPPGAHPPEGDRFHGRELGFTLYERNKIRMQYCEGGTLAATDWHAHASPAGAELFGRVEREDEAQPPRWDRKPMIAVNRLEALECAARMSARATGVRYAVPTEAQWEKAARGGLVGKRYSWGDEPPTFERCDFNRFGDWRLTDPRAYPPNGYGLHAMCGGVHEWTADPYDALAYHLADGGEAPATADQPSRGVLRGGSWADCAGAVTVSHRTAFMVLDRFGDAPNNGFRLIRVLVP